MIGSDIRVQMGALREKNAEIYCCVDPDRVRRQQGPVVRASEVDAFGSASRGGRGESYIAAQRALRTRVRGITQLIDMFTWHGEAEPGIVVDLLGGDGLVAKVVAMLGRERPLIVTCDASPFMVEAAWADGIPALLQRAEASLFRDDSVGGVLLAYGSHHIPTADRPTVMQEALRIIRPGGIFVLHDFLTGSPVDTWFGKVVAVYSATGHDHDHFDSEETLSHLRTAGFTDVELTLMEDPFVATGDTQEEAEVALGKYLVEMYGLVGLVEERGAGGAHERAAELAREIFRYERPGGEIWEMTSSWDEPTGRWLTTMPREALVARGRKSPS